jgi:hypothetical protein
MTDLSLTDDLSMKANDEIEAHASAEKNGDEKAFGIKGVISYTLEVTDWSEPVPESIYRAIAFGFAMLIQVLLDAGCEVFKPPKFPHTTFSKLMLTEKIMGIVLLKVMYLACTVYWTKFRHMCQVLFGSKQVRTGCYQSDTSSENVDDMPFFIRYLSYFADLAKYMKDKRVGDAIDILKNALDTPVDDMTVINALKCILEFWEDGPEWFSKYFSNCYFEAYDMVANRAGVKKEMTTLVTFIACSGKMPFESLVLLNKGISSYIKPTYAGPSELRSSILRNDMEIEFYASKKAYYQEQIDNKTYIPPADETKSAKEQREQNEEEVRIATMITEVLEQRLKEKKLYQEKYEEAVKERQQAKLANVTPKISANSRRHFLRKSKHVKLTLSDPLFTPVYAANYRVAVRLLKSSVYWAEVIERGRGWGTRELTDANIEFWKAHIVRMSPHECFQAEIRNCDYFINRAQENNKNLKAKLEEVPQDEMRYLETYRATCVAYDKEYERRNKPYYEAMSALKSTMKAIMG